ncbi:MAG: HNH endonuclease [Candidatus Margulisiibacteriota bacterium]
MPVINMYNMDCMEAMSKMLDRAYELAIVDPPYFNMKIKKQINIELAIKRLDEIKLILQGLPDASHKTGMSNLGVTKWHLYCERRRIKIRISQNNPATLKEKLDFMKLPENKKCKKCGTTENLSIDHIIPINKGGKHGVDNFQILCISCNCRKGDR